MLRIVGGRVRPGVRRRPGQGHVPRPGARIGAEHGQRFVDLLPAFDAHQGGHLSGVSGGDHLGGGAGELEPFGITRDDALHGVDLFPGGLDRLGAGDRGVDVDRPVLRGDMPGAQLIHRGEGRDARVVETLCAVVAFLPQVPGEVVVSVEDVVCHECAPSVRMIVGEFIEFERSSVSSVEVCGLWCRITLISRSPTSSARPTAPGRFQRTFR